MNHLQVRGRTLIALLAAALFATLVMPAAAVAAQGDSWEDPIPVAAPFSVSTTITAEHLWTWYSVDATVGQTLQILADTPASDGGLSMGLLDAWNAIDGGYISPWTIRLRFMAPWTRSYLLAVSSDTTGVCTVSATLVGAQAFTVGRIAAPTSVRRGHSFTVSARIYPAYNSVRAPIRFEVQRKGKRWKAYGTAASKFEAQFLSGGSSKLLGRLRINKPGTYRIRARFADPVHAARYSKWKTVTIK